MKKIGLLFFTILMMLLFAVSASAAKEGYYTYKSENGVATITDVDTSISGDITIPSTLGGYSVTSIGDYAFFNCGSLTSITIPDSVTSIGSHAFSGCASLTSITIPDSVTSIVFGAFSECTSLTSLTIPDSVTSIGSWAFGYCKSLTSVEIPDSVTSIGELAFYNCRSLTSITIPDSVRSIGNYAFKGCSDLISITIPDGVTSIGDGAFYNCISLTSITLPNSLTSIGVEAFHSTDLTSITIPDSVTSIGDEAFLVCERLTSITVDTANKYYSSDSSGALFDKDKNILIQYPSGNIRTSYVIPDSVTSIGHWAFAYSHSLTSITIPDSVISIGERAFYSCTKLTGAKIGESVTSIGCLPFGACTSLTSITVDENNKKYSNDSNGVLFNKDKTELVAYPIGETRTTYIISESVTAIGDYAFDGCDNITSITIPEGVTSIGDYAFGWCESLTSITIPDSVTSMDIYAFAYCYNLKSVTLSKNLTSISGSTFTSCSSLTDVVIPEGVTSIGDYAFGWCENLASITIPDVVISIGDSAFCGCTSLTDVYYYGAEKQWAEITISSWNSSLINATIHYNYCPNSATNTHIFSSKITLPATHFTEGIKTNTCSACGNSYTEAIAKTKEHIYNAVSNVVAPTCEDKGYTVYVCECGSNKKDNYTDKTGHKYNGQTCVNCGKNCSCNCHKSGISAIFWKIINFFNKLLRKNNICACGAAHY